MFTVEQIKTAHAKVKSGADFPAYIQAIKQLGVTYYETFVTDGHTDLYGEGEYTITNPAKYDSLVIAEASHTDEFIQRLKAHQQGQSDYPTFCRECAELGVEKWVVCLEKMTCTYYNKAGEVLLVEEIPQ